MLKTTVTMNGQVQLGEAAIRAGFEPGAVVDVIISRASGVLILTLDSSPPAFDVSFRRLPQSGPRTALPEVARGR